MSLSDDQVRRLAWLARIAIEPAESRTELQAMAERLNRVLALIDEMRAVDTSGVEPMSHALEAMLDAGQRLRPDAVTESDQHALYQSVAPVAADGKPQVHDGLYLVPKVIE